MQAGRAVPRRWKDHVSTLSSLFCSSCGAQYCLLSPTHESSGASGHDDEWWRARRALVTGNPLHCVTIELQIFLSFNRESNAPLANPPVCVGFTALFMMECARRRAAASRSPSRMDVVWCDNTPGTAFIICSTAFQIFRTTRRTRRPDRCEKAW
jgi:hypothetical protein